MDNYAGGNCSILIYSDNVSIEEISMIMQVEPTSSVNKGQLLSKHLDTYAPHNGWFYKKCFDDLKDVDDTVQHIAKVCIKALDVLKKTQNLDVRIRCFVNSDLAQVGYCLSAETMNLLSKAERGLEIVLFSSGGVEDE